MLKIGYHLSSAKGFLSMGKEASAVGANTFQFFTRNPRGSKAKPICEEDAQALVQFLKEHNFATVMAHAPYTLNLASANQNTREFATSTLQDDLVRMEYIPHQYYNFHPGSHVGQGVEKGIAWIACALNEALSQKQTTTVLLETMSGKGTEIGRTFEELKEILDNVRLSDKMGVCMDLCHVYDAGYDIVHDLNGVLNEFDKIIGLPYLKAVHINDSKNPFKSHKDRHEKIGYGYIGLDTILNVINHKHLQDCIFLLETPNDLEGYAREIKLLLENYTG